MIQSVEHEMVVVAGLVQEPIRLLEIRKIRPTVFVDVRCRAVIHLAMAYHRKCAEAGKIRYATEDTITRGLNQLLGKSARKKTANKKKLLESCLSLIDDLNDWPLVSEHEFRDAADQVVTIARDELARKGLIGIVNRFERRGSDGIYNALVDLSRELHPSSDDSEDALLCSDVDNVWADYQSSKKSQATLRITTPFPHLNQVSGGGKLGRLWLVSAYAKGGKTQLAKDLMYHAATTQRKGVVIITSEQTASDVRQMLVVRHTHKFVQGGLSFSKIDKGELSRYQEKILRKTIDDLSSNKDYGPIRYWRAPSGTTVSDIRSYLESISRRQAVDCVMIDHTMLFSASKPQRDERGNVSEVIRECKSLALEFNNRGLWVVACHQINRDGHDRALKRGYYLPNDLAATSEAERSADLVLWVFRDEQLQDIGEVRIGVAIDRWGPGEPKGWQCMESFESSAILPIESHTP